MNLILIALLMFCSVVVAGQPGQSYPPPGKLIDVGGYRLHLNCSGNKGPTVVLIAGAGDFSFDWSLVQPSIAKSTRVCSYDRAGFAWSEPGPTPRTMKQEAFELHVMLKGARERGPYVLVGHSIGGLITRVYFDQYPAEVAGVVLVDSTHEDTTLMLNNKLTHMRDIAKPEPVPPVQTMKSSPPKPVTKADLDQFEANLKARPPRISPTFKKLPAQIQTMRLWVLSQPPRAERRSLDYLAEELRDLFEARAKHPQPLGNLPLVVILPKQYDPPPPDVDAEEWRRFNEAKQQQKTDFTNLSRNSKLIFAEKSGHHVHLDQPEVVTDAVRLVVDSLRQHQTLDGKKQ